MSSATIRQWDKDEVIADIRRLRRRGDDVSFSAVRGTGLWGAAIRHLGSYRAAVESAGIDYDRISRRRNTLWDCPRITRELRQLRRDGHDIFSRALRKSHHSLHAAAIHWFGSYRKAVEAAGFSYASVSHAPAHHWSREAIAKELRRMRRDGEPLWHSAVDRSRPELVTAAYRYFGTYRKAVEAAGIDYLSVRVRPHQIWTERNVVAELRRLKREPGGLWFAAVRRRSPRLLRGAVRVFGSYRRAAKAAGIGRAALKAPPYRRWSPEKVVEELARAHQAGESVKPTRLQAARPSFYHVCRKRFGTYRKAVEAAGIDYASVARVLSDPMPADEVLERLRTLDERGADLRYAPLAQAEPRLLDAARRRFGSYPAAMKAAGLDYPPTTPLRHWTWPLVLKTLRELDAAGEDLRFRPMRRRRLPLFEACRYYFGTYTNAVRKAGIDYDSVVRRHLKRNHA